MNNKSSGFVVLDSNAWVYTTRLLRTGLGAELLHSVRQTTNTLATLALPEIVELEIRKHVMKLGGEAVGSIHEGYRLIEQIVGARDEYRVPEIEALAQHVEASTKRSVPFIRSPFDIAARVARLFLLSLRRTRQARRSLSSFDPLQQSRPAVVDFVL
jgi:hypothetical protein